ncbi:hypothetical protein C2W62_08790 [Candidatus Entotheonella serta]|nr:hypothetical protein C2W62_08790 [Candidatus Entotheonella serta]
MRDPTDDRQDRFQDQQLINTHGAISFGRMIVSTSQVTTSRPFTDLGEKQMSIGSHKLPTFSTEKFFNV